MAALSGWLGVAAFTGAATAQTASEITPSDFAPEPRRLTGALVFTGEPGLGAPPGAEALTIEIAGVDIEGAFPEMAAANDAAVARLTDGRIAASVIFETAQALEAAYADAGFVLARIVLPPQELRDGGRLRLTVVDGFIERVDTAAVPEPVRARIDEVVAPLADRPGLRLDAIERALLIAGDTFGVALDSALARGEAAGGTQLLLDAQFRPVTGFVGINNELAEDLGGFTLDAGVELNALLGLGETLYGRVSVNPSGDPFGSRPRMRTLAAGAVMPVGRDGLTFTLEGVHSRTTPDEEGVPTTSRFDRVSLRLAYPVIRTRARTLSGRLAFDAQADRQDVILAAGEAPIYRDRLRVLRLGATLVQTLRTGGLVELDALASFGVDALGARGEADATPALPLSRQAADAQFSKLAVSAQMVRPLGERLVGVLAARGQTSFGTPLLKSEQISAAGPGLLSGLESGSLAGDSGWLVRAELRAPNETTAAGAPLRLTPYAFGALGMVYLHQPTALERDRTRATSVGLGLEVLSTTNEPFGSLSGRIELSRGSRNDDKPNDTRLGVGASLRF